MCVTIYVGNVSVQYVYNMCITCVEHVYHMTCVEHVYNPYLWVRCRWGMPDVHQELWWMYPLNPRPEARGDATEGG